MKELLQEIIANPLSSLAIIGNLVIIESLLSVDNAAVLATMVMDLSHAGRKKALRYGILGAYIFRGAAMAFAAYLIGIWWLKPVGGLYLLYLVRDWWKGRQSGEQEGQAIDKKSNWFYKAAVKRMGALWATVMFVELVDIAFSIDNVFAAVAFTPNIILVCTGVFIGIPAMRYIAQWFVNLMETYRFLKTSAFIVIGILGIKLVLSLLEHFEPETAVAKFLHSRTADMAMSGMTVCIFFIPVITSLLFNVPQRNIK